jgi:iron complex outermembrane recepter protein
MLKNSFLVLAMLWAYPIFGQTLIKGKITDKEDQTQVIGARVYFEDNSGATTNVGGIFSFKTNLQGEQTLKISLIGYETFTKKVVLNAETLDIGEIALSSSQMLKDVEVLADFIDNPRTTPISVSTMAAQDIQLKIGSQELVEVLKTTPSIYATKSGGGYGDARISVRGFGQENIAVMVNGIHVNDMEDGMLYWSNWAGLGDFAKAIQVQRGLGASKMTINAVGGTLNIITKNLEPEQNGFVAGSVGNYNSQKMSFAYNTGMLKGDWALSLGASRSSSDGYVAGTDHIAHNYFASLTKVFGTKHTLNFTAIGSPQQHGHAFIMGSDSSYATHGNFYNPVYAGAKNNNINAFHIPLFSLNYIWNISDKMSWQNVAYALVGSGYLTAVVMNQDDARIKNAQDKNNLGLNPFAVGFENILTDPKGFVRKPYRGAGQTLDWSLIESYNRGVTPSQWQSDFTGIMDNVQTENGYQSLLAMTGIHNKKQFYGATSSLRYEPIKSLSITGGLDYRYFQVQQYRSIMDLMGGDFYLDNSDLNQPNKMAKNGDIIDFNYMGYVNWIGGFAQVEYKNDYISTFLTGSLSSKSYRRKDFLHYANNDPERLTTWKNYLSYNVKTGIGYNINKNHHLFFNAGHYNNAPLINNIFLNGRNDWASNVKNEKVYATELGYGINYAIFSAHVTAYYTLWKDRSFKLDFNNISTLVPGISQQHYGVEFDFELRPLSFIQINGMFSWGNWSYLSYVKGVNIVNASNTANFETIDLDLRKVKEGGAAQLTSSLSVRFDIWKGLFIALDAYYADFLYAYFDPANRKGITTPTSVQAPDAEQSWRLPAYYTLDAQLGWNFALKGKNKLTLLANVNNLTNHLYITEANDGVQHNRASSNYFYGAPIMWTGTVKFSF